MGASPYSDVVRIFFVSIHMCVIRNIEGVVINLQGRVVADYVGRNVLIEEKEDLT